MSIPHPLSVDEFHRLIGPSTDDDRSVRRDERRQFKRFAVRIDLRCQGLSEQSAPSGNIVAGVSLNMSQGGILFDTADEIYATVVLVQFMSGEDVIAERAVRVDRRTPAHGAAVLAGEFVTVPPNDAASQAIP